ncbi:MAG: hypothetical protein KF683_13680, partial [Rubrivivax sp.]|nr:hypothetical protein [Rubrivivax sp.]
MVLGTSPPGIARWSQPAGHGSRATALRRPVSPCAARRRRPRPGATGYAARSMRRASTTEVV